MPGEAAVRKANKFGRIGAAAKMVSTYAWSSILTNCSIFIVDFIVHVGSLLFSSKEEDKSLKKIVRKTLTLIVGRIGAVAGGSVFSAVGTVVYPGVGTFLVGAIGEVVGSILLVSACGLQR